MALRDSIWKGAPLSVAILQSFMERGSDINAANEVTVLCRMRVLASAGGMCCPLLPLSSRKAVRCYNYRWLQDGDTALLTACRCVPAFDTELLEAFGRYGADINKPALKYCILLGLK